MAGAASGSTRHLVSCITGRRCNHCRTGRWRRSGIRVCAVPYSSWTCEAPLSADPVSVVTLITHGLRVHYTWSTAGILAAMIPSESVSEDSPAALDALVENHRAFLRYLERRVGDRDLAEDILQDAFIKVMDRPDQAPAVLPSRFEVSGKRVAVGGSMSSIGSFLQASPGAIARGVRHGTRDVAALR
jgi:Sigma-70 region 2